MSQSRPQDAAGASAERATQTRRSGLARQLSSLLGPWRLPGATHDPGKVVLDLVIALGGDAACDIAVVRAQPQVFGPVASDPIAVTGTPVDDAGRIHSESIDLAARNALRSVVDHLSAERGFTRQQAYALCSVAVDLRISQVVDVPNVLVSAMVPMDIFP